MNIAKMRKDMAQLAAIENALEVVYTAHCDQCGIDHSDNTDEMSFAEKLQKLGWRCNDADVLFCPQCAKLNKIK
jgi:hypothetical protein